MNTSKLIQEQLRLAEKVMTTDIFDEINYIAGCDQSYTKENKILSVIVVIDAKTMEIADKASAEVECSMPYMPGLLFYREAPAVIGAFAKLKTRPDLLIVDANGILHPRRIGMASQLGIVLDIPTIGITKNLFIGKPSSDGKIEIDKEIRGEALKTKEYANPVYVSPGHRISLRTAVDMVKKLIIPPHKLPKPLHLAHRFARKATRNGNNSAEDQEPKEAEAVSEDSQ